jgi:hypothetical protein
MSLNDDRNPLGQLVSEAKSSIFFSPCTSADTWVEVWSVLNIMTKAITDKYLGLPPIVGVDRTDYFQHLVERNCSKLIG